MLQDVQFELSKIFARDMGTVYLVVAVVVMRYLVLGLISLFTHR